MVFFVTHSIMQCNLPVFSAASGAIGWRSRAASLARGRDMYSHAPTQRARWRRWYTRAIVLVTSMNKTAMMSVWWIWLSLTHCTHIYSSLVSTRDYFISSGAFCGINQSKHVCAIQKDPEAGGDNVSRK